MSNSNKIFDEYIKRTGGRVTEQKRTIIKELTKIRTHFDIEDFIDKIRKKDNKASRATVYRVVKELLNEGFIQKITAKEGKIFYEHNFSSQHHDHIICNSCGKIFELKEDKVSQYIEDYCKKMDFITEYRSLHIYGTCSACK